MTLKLRNTRLKSRFLAAVPLFVSVLLFGCSLPNEAEMQADDMLRQNNALERKNSQLAAELAEENARTADLKMELVEKQKEINRIKSTQESLAQEIAHSKARVSKPNTKVEAVTYVAEVAIEINTAREVSTDSEQQVFAQADQLIAASKAELERGDYDMAHSLAFQAMELTRDIRLRTALNSREEKSIYVDFTAPLHLQLAKRGNVRKEPAADGHLVMTLSPRTKVTASGYQGDWIKVTCENGQEGWIHYSLLADPNTTLPIPKPVKKTGFMQSNPD